MKHVIINTRIWIVRPLRHHSLLQLLVDVFAWQVIFKCCMEWLNTLSQSLMIRLIIFALRAHASLQLVHQLLIRHLGRLRDFAPFRLWTEPIGFVPIVALFALQSLFLTLFRVAGKWSLDILRSVFQFFFVLNLMVDLLYFNCGLITSDFLTGGVAASLLQGWAAVFAKSGHFATK